MIVVSHRMIKPIQKSASLRSALVLAALFALTSCNPTAIDPKSTRDSVVGNNDGSITGAAYIYPESPFILSNDRQGLDDIDIGDYVDAEAAFITANNQLTANCSMSFFFNGVVTDEISNCLRSFGLETESVPLARQPDNTWIYSNGSRKFYQVNTLFHLNKGVNTFFSKLEFAYKKAQSMGTAVPKSIPSYLKDSKMFWFKGVGNLDAQQFQNSFLSSFAYCNFDGNASFSAAGPELCFGSLAAHPNFHFVQDPSVMLHELGHAMGSIMLNLRNGTATGTHPFRSSFGKFGYSEASAINEGFADYFSYVVNKRTHFAEWSLGKTVNQSRPMSERDPAHISAINTTSEGRLSYPQYLLYDPNFPTQPFEDEHYAGQIISHYLVALTENLKSSCSLTSQSDGGHSLATSYVMLLLTETFSEIGDLYARGVDEEYTPSSGAIYFNNLDPSNSFLWSKYVNPATFRRFSQLMAKNIKKYITGSLCGSFDQNKSEKLLDDYGLLLFKTYNNNGNSTKLRSKTYNSVVTDIDALQPLTLVRENNRRKSVLVSKTLIDLSSKVEASTTNPVGVYIIDNRTDIENLLSALLFKGFPVPLSSNVASVDYNNGNIKVSPGEIVGVIPNLYNSSNTTMSGIHILAEDWDHVSYDTLTGKVKPCAFDSDITIDQGGVSNASCTATSTEYTKFTKTTVGTVAPVCLVQLDEGETTRWVSQNEFRVKQGLALQDKDCLGYTSSGVSDVDFTYNPHECLMRFLPGANDAFFSKIDSRETYYESVVKDLRSPQFNVGNLMLMEVNKWVPPGTKFKCRLRVNFSNCSDCHADAAAANDDYQDSDLMGAKPYKILNIDFDIND